MGKKQYFCNPEVAKAASPVNTKNALKRKLRKMKRRLFIMTIVVVGWLVGIPAKGVPGTDSTKAYSEAQKLIYEDVWDLWPYSYLNDEGEPEGFNIDLVKLLLKELGIPYEIRLKPANEAFHDLKDGRSDLMLGLSAGFHDEFGLYSRNAVTLFTQSVVTPKNREVEIKNLHDLGNHKVIVNDSSLCHHLMIDYKWERNAVPTRDLREAIQQVSATEEGQIVWNTLSLKWLLRRYHIDNLELTPVNMPHGEYKFMSNDQQLLDQLDAAFTRLSSADKLLPLYNKWFYPERQKQAWPVWIWYLLGGAVLLVVILGVYGLSYFLQNRRLTRANKKRNRRLSLILQTSHVRIWTYDIRQNQFAWRNENGQVAYVYTMEEFAQRYSPEDFMRLKAALDKLAAGDNKNEREEHELTLELKAKDTEGGDNELHDFFIVLSVLSRDRSGKPTVIIGTKKDITEERELQRLDEERTLRYWSIFYTPVAGIILFDRNGVLVNINPKACEMFECEPEEIIDEHVTLDDMLDTGNLSLAETDGFHCTQYVDIDRIPPEQRRVKSVHRHGKLCNEFRLMTVYDDSHELLGVFAICRDITSVAADIGQHTREQARLDAVKRILSEYDADIDSILHESDVRLATYSPGSHTLKVYHSVDEVQHALTQTRCMTLVDDNSKKLAMRILNVMDAREDKEIRACIRTSLRIKGNHRLEVEFRLMPLHDKHGKVVEYLGLLRDISELSSVKRQMAIETAKVQEVENTKNSFVKNMVQEIRTPMDTVVNYVGQLNAEAATADEPSLRQGILDNADYLLHLIDNVLYLSRLEAGMVEINKRPCDFANLFESQCMEGWAKYQNSDTDYVVESPYEQLMVDIDAENLGQAIGQIAANAAQHTNSGVVRARYDYIGRRLLISIDDTGEGIPHDELERLNGMGPNSTHSTKGLGLAITKELVRQMGGTVEISSETGSGTTVYITIPCHASVVKRKKLVGGFARRILPSCLLALLPLMAVAQPLTERYTKERPVVIVCDWDKAPYEFLKGQGQPAGSNVDVMTAVMKELNLPVKFVMKEWSTALKTFERGDADLILANARRYRKAPYVVSENIVNYNRIRVAMYRDSVEMVSLKQLEREGAVFKTGDYSANYFADGDSINLEKMEFQTPKTALLGLINGDYKYYVWGEEPLKWKIKEFNLKGLTLNDVGIPISEIHIVGRDRQLVEQVDDQYSRLKQNGTVVMLQNKWLHPEQAEEKSVPMALYAIIAFFLIAAIIYFFNRLARAHVKSATRNSTELNDMMVKALHMGNYIVMEYDIVNNRMTNRYGHILPAEGMTLEEFASRIHPEQQQEFTKKMRSLMDGRERRFELNKRWNQGTEDNPNWLIFHGHAISELDNDGHPAYVVNAIHDVTQEVEEDKAARDLVHKYESMANIPFVAMSFYDKNGWLIDLNDSMKELCNISDDNPENKRFWETVCMFDVPLFRGVYAPGEREDMLFCQHMEYPEQGLNKYIECHIRPLFNAEGDIANYFITAFNVTLERNQDKMLYQIEHECNNTQKRIALQKERLAYLLSNSDRYLMRSNIDREEIIFFRSPEKPEYVFSFSHFLNMIAQKDRDQVSHILYDSMTKDPRLLTIHLILPWERQSGTVFNITFTPIANERGQVIGHEGIAADITTLYNAHTALVEETSRANDSLRQKSGFMASMTHELRTPLNAIVGFTSVLEALGDSEERGEYVRIIRNSSDMLQRLINDIIESSTITGEALSIKSEEVNFAMAFDDIALMLEQRVQNPNIKFIKENPYDNFITTVDIERMQQVLTNFVTNAVKFTREGHIRVGYRYENHGLYLYCEDTGIGIPKEKQECIFNRFVKLDEFVQGTGMGLAICKSIAERCNGNIGVSSDGDGMGSTFWMWIPCERKLTNTPQEA